MLYIVQAITHDGIDKIYGYTYNKMMADRKVKELINNPESEYHEYETVSIDKINIKEKKKGKYLYVVYSITNDGIFKIYGYTYEEKTAKNKINYLNTNIGNDEYDFVYKKITKI